MTEPDRHEANVLGSILLQPDIFDDISQELDPELFAGTCRAVCVAMHRIAAKKDALAISILSVCAEDPSIDQEKVEILTEHAVPYMGSVLRSLKIVKIKAATERFNLRLMRATETLREAPNQAAEVAADIERDLEDFTRVAAPPVDPEVLLSPIQLIDQVEEVFRPTTERAKGLPLPWPKTHEWFRIRPAEVSLWQGINSHGKSMILSDITAYLLSLGEKIFVASMEMTPPAQMERMYRQIMCKEAPTEAEHRACAEWIGDRLKIVNITGTAKAEKIIALARHACEKLGITQIVIDSLSKCGFDEDDYNGQKGFVDALTDLAKETNAHIHLVVHPRKREDEKHSPGKMDVKGTGAITDMVDNVLTVWRNKDKEDHLFQCLVGGQDPSEDWMRKPCATLAVQKQRHYSWEGRFGLWFHKSEMRYSERFGGYPDPYFQVSAD